MILSAEVRDNLDPSFPFIAIVSDENGKVFATLAAMSRLAAEMFILEVFAGLEEKIATRHKEMH